MANVAEVKEALFSSEQGLGNLAYALSPSEGDPEELGMLMRAESLEIEADNLRAQATAEKDVQRQAALIRQAKELDDEATSIRHLAVETLQQRAAAAEEIEQAAKAIRGQVDVALRTATPVPDIAAQVAAVSKGADEVKDSLSSAASMALDRGQTRQCAGLVLYAQEQGAQAALACQGAQNAIFEYAARL